MAQEQVILYEYRGNRFYLELLSGWYSRRASYTIRKIEMTNSRLELPDSCKGDPVARWYMRESEQLSTAKSLFIPASITEISIENNLFPELEEVEVAAGHTVFSTEGKMLYSADGRELLYSLAGGNQERAVVPKTVRRISRDAFWYTACCEIVFENADISVERDAFEGSEWMKRQQNFCIVGNLFFRLKHSVDRLVIPDGIRRFHENAFRDAVPVSLDTPLMPSRSNIEDLGGRSYHRNGVCRELILRSRQAAINFNLLRGWHGLGEIHVPEGHKRYAAVDGVIFSRDKKTLLFYPQGKTQSTYRIPEGVVKIGRAAFQEQDYLTEVTMPDSVATVGMSAFFCCGALQKVNFSANIRELPDAGAYQRGGVFEQCGCLREAALPGRLRYLGSYAFHASGLRRITLNEGLRQMGEYALAAEGLRTVSLPASLERLGRGALFWADTAEAYTGTAKGLVPALNAVPPYCADKGANVEWKRRVVTARGKRGGRTETFLLPGSLKRSAAYHLDMAWNGEAIDYEEYDACFEAIQDGEERLEFAELGILRLGREEDTPYTAYMRHTAMKIASHLVEERREREFLAFLQQGYLSESALSRLLKLTNEKGLTTCSAYILKYQEAKGSRKKRRFLL